ncbi:MAG: hypothetical protein DHS20C14_22370 [Phycisphaeraceae bacterium]|nr:MAG: hypothetical protein DHS20C14_22370 [Phycisphaeraceae bacterium]
MDERQAQIKEGAGLEESRINQDFVDFISKWSTPVLFLLALAMLGWWGYGKLQQMKEAHVAEAFGAYNAAIAGDNPSPDSLRRVADEYADVPGLAAMARLRAAEVYLESVWLGTQPGAELTPSGALLNAEDALTDEDTENFLAAADEEYRKVLDAAEKDDRYVHALSAMWGRAAVAGSRGDMEGASALYTRIEQFANAEGDELQARLAARKRDSLSEFAQTPKLFGPDELPPIILEGSEDPLSSIIDSLEDAAAEAVDDAASALEGEPAPAEATTEGADDEPGSDTP